MRALTIAATGMNAQSLNVEVISNNIANLNTTSFKRQQADFNDLIYQASSNDVGFQSNAGGDISPVGTLVGLGTKVAGIYRNNEQGTLVQTDNNLDVAIQGRGYFQVTDANGLTFYTRAGSFQQNQDGTLVNLQGLELDPNISIPDNAREVQINTSGEVLIKVDATEDQVVVGRLTLVTFINENGLTPQGNNLFSETESSGAPITSNPGEPGVGTLQSGFLESSNVDAVKEITNLITAQRAYELNSRVISTADEMLSSVNNIT